MEKSHKQIVTSYPAAIKAGQGRIHVSNPIPFHAKCENVDCPQCSTSFIVSEGFSRAQLLEILAEHHQRQQEHPDFIASAPEWTQIVDCDCQEPKS